MTLQVFLAGAVPEVMLHLRQLGVLKLNCMTVSGATVEQNLDWWEKSERRRRFRDILKREDGVDADDVIVSSNRHFGGTLIFPLGNFAPQGSVVKATAIDASLWHGNVYDRIGRARIFTSEESAMAALKTSDAARIERGDVIVLLCRGPIGAGMPETAQITIALKNTAALKDVALLTDGRFSGFSSGPCIGHIGPEALAGGAIGKLRDGDRIHIRLDRTKLEGSIDLLAPDAAGGTQVLASRPLRDDLRADPNLPNATRLWAALQQASGGTWGGCVYDTDAIVEKLV
jgi:xylonate dehydratase